MNPNAISLIHGLYIWHGLPVRTHAKESGVPAAIVMLLPLSSFKTLTSFREDLTAVPEITVQLLKIKGLHGPIISSRTTIKSNARQNINLGIIS